MPQPGIDMTASSPHPRFRLVREETVLCTGGLETPTFCSGNPQRFTSPGPAVPAVSVWLQKPVGSGSPQRFTSPGPVVSSWLQKPVVLPPHSKVSVPTPPFVHGMSPLGRGRAGHRSYLDSAAGTQSIDVAPSHAAPTGGSMLLPQARPQVPSTWPYQAYSSQIPTMGQLQPVAVAASQANRGDAFRPEVTEEPNFRLGQQSPEFGSFLAAPPQSPVLLALQVQSSQPSHAYRSQTPVMLRSQLHPVAVAASQAVEEPKVYFDPQTQGTFSDALGPEFGSFFVAAPPPSTRQAVMMCAQTPAPPASYQQRSPLPCGRASVALPPAGSLQSPRRLCWQSSRAPSPFLFHKPAGVQQGPKPGELGSPYRFASPLMATTTRFAASPYRSNFTFR